jgi:hypothetical protein
VFPAAVARNTLAGIRARRALSSPRAAGARTRCSRAAAPRRDLLRRRARLLGRRRDLLRRGRRLLCHRGDLADLAGHLGGCRRDLLDGSPSPASRSLRARRRRSRPQPRRRSTSDGEPPGRDPAAASTQRIGLRHELGARRTTTTWPPSESSSKRARSGRLSTAPMRSARFPPRSGTCSTAVPEAKPSSRSTTGSRAEPRRGGAERWPTDHRDAEDGETRTRTGDTTIFSRELSRRFSGRNPCRQAGFESGANSGGMPLFANFSGPNVG